MRYRWAVLRQPAWMMLTLLASLLAQPPALPTFRSGIDVVQLDVAVLDKDRKPIRGLTAADFVIEVDGTRQPIVAFDEVVMPQRPAPTAAWMRDVAPDVKTNAVGEPRLFLIVMDDMRTPPDPYMVDAGKKVARAVVDELLPSDLAAVVFTKNNSGAQEFTSDRALLLAAIESFRFGWVPEMAVLSQTMSAGVLRDAIQFLGRRAQGRSAIMWISVGGGIAEMPDVTRRSSDAGIVAENENLNAREEREALIAEQIGLSAISSESRLARVPVYGFSIAGLHVAGTSSINKAAPPELRAPQFTDRSAVMGAETMRTISAATGGRAIVADNEPARAVPAIFEENSSYYLIGYRATYPLADGRTRRIQIRVDRPGALVTPSVRLLRSDKRSTRPAAAASLPLQRAIADIVPKSDLRLAVTAAPFALRPTRLAGGRVRVPQRNAAVLAALRVERPAPPERTMEQIEALAIVFTPEGKELLTLRQQAAVTLRPSDNDAVFDILVPLTLKPGRYNIRYSARSERLDRTGSVYTDVIVPDFGRERLSMSGVILTGEPMPIAAPRDAFAALVPVVPTTRRGFDRQDRVRAFMRVYQTGSAGTIRITARVTDTADRVAAESADTLAVSRFAADNGADFTYELPLASLAPGNYLLSIEARRDARTAVHRDVRFAIR